MFARFKLIHFGWLLQFDGKIAFVFNVLSAENSSMIPIFVASSLRDLSSSLQISSLVIFPTENICVKVDSFERDGL